MKIPSELDYKDKNTSKIANNEKNTAASDTKRNIKILYMT